jgi:hypothetical protein
MRKIVLVSILALFALVAFVPFSTAEMAKEGTGSSTTIYSGTMQIVPLDENHLVISYQNKGAMISDTGKGPFNNMSIHNVGTIYFENGVGKLLGYITCTDPEGDKVLVEVRENNAKSGSLNSGTGKFIYGSGKFTGIEGTMEYKRWSVRPATKDTFQAIAKSKSSWKIP